MFRGVRRRRTTKRTPHSKGRTFLSVPSAIERTTEEVSEGKGKGKGVFGTHTKEAFSALRDARALGSWPSRGRVLRVVGGGSRSRRRDVVVFIH